MNKNLLQDMVKIKRTKQGIVLKEIDKKLEKKIENDDFFKPRARVSFSEEVNKEKKSPKNALWFVAIITVVFLLFAISTLFTEAKVSVNPKVKEITLDEKIFAQKDSSGEDLSFDLVVIGGEESIPIEGQGKEEVSNSAKGTVIIYNDYNNTAQALDINTRLEGSNGKIYKTEKKITVPGKSSDGTPGKVEVGIYANEPGKEYNSEPLDFKILGFKGSPKYTKFYGRSKDEIIGGIVGTLPTVTLEEKSTAMEQLTKKLEVKLLQKTINQIPKDFILFDGAYTLIIDDKNEEYDKEKNTIVISLKGTLYGFLFKETELTKKVASSVVPDYDNSDIYIPKIKDLKFSLTDNTYSSFKDVESISFKLSGPTKIVWKVDEDALIGDLLEKSKKDFESLLLQYSSIDTASVVIRPFWKKSFPDKIKDITVNVNYP
ncbi:MAG: hypothetical protein KBD52_02720 [Candidatus Pacebacteria bacterium]|nr:hypothetical protein [Candidatus Paceibacterota bacterium]